MNIQQFAVHIISCWEHTGHYDCHGDGAYGLIGWQEGQLENLLQAYLDYGGKLSKSPAWYAADLMKPDHGQNPDLNAAASDQDMQTVQWQMAAEYVARAIKYQWQFYPFASVMGQLLVADIGVNSGIWNYYVKHAHYHRSDHEEDVLRAVLSYRRKALKDYGIWQKYGGIRRRWEFYRGLLNGNGLAGIGPYQHEIEVNGVVLEFDGEPIEPMAPE